MASSKKFEFPFNGKYVPILQKTASDNGIPFKAIRIESKEQAQAVPSPCTSYALFKDGEFLTNEQQNENRFLTEGLVLQEEKYWKQFLGTDIIPRNNHAELYFEEKDIEGFIKKLEQLYPETEYVNRLMTHSWGQTVVRFYDLDGNLIEVGTPVN